MPGSSQVNNLIQQKVTLHQDTVHQLILYALRIRTNTKQKDKESQVHR